MPPKYRSLWSSLPRRYSTITPMPKLNFWSTAKGMTGGERGRPENLRSDNGPEFTSRRMLGWAEDWKVGLVHIQPGKAARRVP